MTTTATEASLIATLPGRYYTEPEIFAVEQEVLLESMWVAVARVEDLVNPGDYQTVTVGRENVLVLRDNDGQLRAFLNVCRHRGARLCSEESGHLRRAVQCPYHAWTYAFSGELISAPNRGDIPDLDRVRHGMLPVALTEWLGYAWVCLADEPPDFMTSVGGQVSERLGGLHLIDLWKVDVARVGKRITYDVAANWKLIVENFMECYHCATIHPELTDVLPEFKLGYAAQYYVGHGAEFGEDIKGFTVDGRPGFHRFPSLDEDHDRRYYAITVRPQVFINLVPDHIIFHRMVPLAADRTVVVCDWLFAPDVLAEGVDVTASVELFHRVNLQDFDACERCQPNMDSRAYRKGGLLVPSEHHIGAFHEWLRGLVDPVLADQAGAH
jgi:Rieske 2Fe-2S family protein